MSSLQQRIDNWFEKDYRSTFMERVRLIAEMDSMFVDQPKAVRYGNTLKYMLERISQPVDQDELIVGSVVEEIPTQAEHDKYIQVYQKWWDKSTEERQKDTLFYYSEGWLKCRPPWFISYGHLAIDWEGIVQKGLLGYKQEAQDFLAKQDDLDKKDFLSGMILCYDGMIDYVKRYADTAENGGRSDIAAELAHIAEQPPRTMREALQLIWMVTLVFMKVAGCGVFNYGRMDQYLYGLYKSDMQNGVQESDLTELLKEFYFKNNDILVLTDHMSQEITEVQYTLEVAYDDPNYITLAGKRYDGENSINELSYLMLDATHQMRLKNPVVIVRYFDGMDDQFFLKACEAMRDNTTVFFYNDETMIPALKRYGAQEPEVYDYGLFGCNDPDLGAYEGGLRQVWFNLAKPLELAIHRGDYPMEPKETQNNMQKCGFDIDDMMTGLMTGPYYGIDTGDVNEWKSIDDVLEAYKKQLSALVKEYRERFEENFKLEQAYFKGGIRAEDCFLKGTAENGESWILGGTKYHKVIAQGSGLATVVDSLYAMDKLLFQDKRMTPGELAELLEGNFQSDELLGMTLKKKYGKFGNDIEEVDRFAEKVVKIFTDVIAEYNGDQYLYQFFPTVSTDRDFTTMGLYVGATPDGRKMGEQISENQSPTQGMDMAGLTALLNSVSKIPFELITGGPLNVRIHPGSVKGEGGLKNMAALFKTYMQKRGLQLQVNVVDSEMLRSAQADPKKYRNLCVRVTGYSAFFVEMGKKAQEELIARTEQNL